ncbi:MAG: hypothetical protein M1829_002172 [Trizodia sp. TS-e1964]|nr:MAG: hypothetical protein M1829_002172 [Trizodia sp. TS-e1964]
MSRIPTIDTFLSSINGFLRSRDAIQIADWLRVEPPLPEVYYSLGAEVRLEFPKGSHESLEKKCETMLPEDSNRRLDDETGDSWPGFVMFMKEYLEFWRDVNFDNLLETYELLSGLVKYIITPANMFLFTSIISFLSQCITAMSNNSYGIIVLPTMVRLSATLTKLAINLDERPELTAHLTPRHSIASMDTEGDSKQSLVEGTAELLQRAFTMCLNERSVNRGLTVKPEGKKVGVYAMANLVLKLLFQCRKTRLASQLFTNISQQSPALSHYPASQRVTYLYYLGRFYLSNNHFFRAQCALQAAYEQCHRQATQQLSLILIYLITTNLILGRFPSEQLLRRPEAHGLRERFGPICMAIVKGDLVTFNEVLHIQHREWFIRKAIFLPILNRCEILVWRSLARRIFLINGFNPGVGNKAPTLSLTDIHAAAQFLEKKYRAVPEYSNGTREYRQDIHIDPDLEHADDEEPSDLLSTVHDVESIVASLVDQDLLHGYISHRQLRFAILGAKSKGAMIAGFPNIWKLLELRSIRKGEAQNVPGWVREDKIPALNVGPGMVINLSGARPAGSPLI